MQYCTYCGAANNAQATYSASCGNRLQSGLPARKNSTLPAGLIGGLLVLTLAFSLIGGVALVSIHLDPTINFGSSLGTTPSTSSPTNPSSNQPLAVTTSQSSENCPNAQAQEGPPHPADGTDWTINSLNGGAIIVNFYFPNTQYSGNNKVLVPEGTNSITLKGGGGSYWQYQMGCATNAQQDFEIVDHYAAVNLQDLENQGLVTVS